MEKCPRCGKYMVAFDGYYQIKKCHNDSCSAHIHENNSYSFLRSAPDNTIHRIHKFPDGTEKIVKVIPLQ